VGSHRSSLPALTAAALALPGLAAQRAQAADDDGFVFDYARYQEGSRKLYGVDSAFDPIEVDTLHLEGRLTFLDRLKLAVDYLQDTWSGATPIATAPLVLGGNRAAAPDGISSATPYLNGDLFLDGSFEPLAVDDFGSVIGPDDQLVHTLSSASPEVRNQIGFALGWELDEGLLSLGSGVSLEDDYASRFVELSGRFDFHQRRTSVTLGASYTNGETDARLDPDAVPYIDTSGFASRLSIDGETGNRTLRGGRDDEGAWISVSRTLSRNVLLELGFAYAHAEGYLENPYKVVQVAFIDPEQQFLAPPGGYYAQVKALLEQRPHERNQFTWSARLVHYMEPLDGALHLGYRFFHDDWGIEAHTLEATFDLPLAAGFTLTPRIRYYSQGEADFYQPWLISDQAYQTIVTDPDTGDILSITPFDRALLPRNFSSDARLSGFGALSAGATLALQLAQGIRFETGFEYYTHAGDLALAGGEDAYADYDAWLVTAGIRLDASALHAVPEPGAASEPDGHVAEHAHAAGHAPAGVMAGHMLSNAGDFMLGVRYAYARRAGDVKRGTRKADDAEIGTEGCDGTPCTTAPDEMNMNMVMLDLMVAPTDWLTLAVMPSFVDMDMDLRTLAGAAPDVHHVHGHTTGGVGDLQLLALGELLEVPGHRIHAGLGVSAPTGDVDEKRRRSHQESPGFTHYGMQLGSGTWDLLPSLTYAGHAGRFFWGAQASGIVRLEHRNESGYALGDVFETTAWGGYGFARWLAASARFAFATEGEIRGRYDGPRDESGPMDFRENYGGRRFDVGFGLDAHVPAGLLSGNRLRVEWLQPVYDDFEGYQLERVGALFAVWSVEF
jgi:hypothetical protein